MDAHVYKEGPKTPGDVVIAAIIRAAALDTAIPAGDGLVFVWHANAAEQIEAALLEFGWELKKIKD